MGPELSIKVKERLAEEGIETTHEERVALDMAIEQRTGKWCDEGVKDLTPAQFRELVKSVKERLRARKAREAAGLDADAEERAIVEAAYQ